MSKPNSFFEIQFKFYHFLVLSARINSCLLCIHITIGTFILECDTLFLELVFFVPILSVPLDYKLLKSKGHTVFIAIGFIIFSTMKHTVYILPFEYLINNLKYGSFLRSICILMGLFFFKLQYFYNLKGLVPRKLLAGRRYVLVGTLSTAL